MTFGQLFKIMNPDVRIRKNGTCMWLYFDDVNYYTIGTEWWDKEIPDNVIAVLKEQEAVKPIFIETTRTHEAGFMEVSIKCGNCKSKVQYYPERWKYCPWCGRAVKWDE